MTVSRRAASAIAIVATAFMAATAVDSLSLGEWQELPKYPIQVFEAQGTIMKCGGDTYLFVFGGFKDFPDTTAQSFKRNIDRDDNAWEQIADMPTVRGHALTHMAQAVVRNVIYLAGGYLGAHPGPSVKSVFAYDCVTDEWTILPSLPQRRAGGALVHSDPHNSLIFAGGGNRKTEGDEPNADIEKHIDYGTTWVLDLDKVDAGWTNLGIKMPDPRNHQGGVLACDRLYWMGGQHEENEASGNRDTCNELVLPERAAKLTRNAFADDADAGWAATADLPEPLGHISASTMAFGCDVIVVGGVQQSKERTKDVLHWDSEDFEAGSWKIIGEYPVGLATPVCGIAGGYIYCATGSGEGEDLAYKAQLLE